ncbi:MAG: tRNA (adenosine(37)-N6)-threonylcarbamoyltransferase complex ATPase subunit type 1 TsaE, partial [Novosphingobium sp.]
MRITLPDLAATEALGARIAAVLRPGDVVALSGGLGAGKTTLARAIIAALGHTGEVPSPSFAIIETYDPPAVRLPLVTVAGETLLDHVLHLLADAGVGRIVVNVHYRPDQIEAHLAAEERFQVTISDERALLRDTGGGLV